MQCPRCGEWSVAITRPGHRTCLACGWTRPVEWSAEPTKEAGATYGGKQK